VITGGAFNDFAKNAASTNLAFTPNSNFNGPLPRIRNIRTTGPHIIFAIAVLFFANSRLLDTFILDAHAGFIISIAGLGTMLTAALQYINRYEERAAQHKLAGSEYSILKRQIERCLANGISSDELEERLKLDYDLLAKHCPLVEHKFWKGVVKAVEPHKKREEAFFAIFEQDGRS
jgi:hypothetical protein